MSFRDNHGSGNKAVSLLATCFVVAAGSLTCMAIAFLSNPEHPDEALLTAGGVSLGIILLLWMLRVRPPENRTKSAWSWLWRRKRKIAYQVKPKLPPSERVSAPPGPPTVDSIRQISGGTSTWVPAQSNRPQSRDSAPQ